MSSPYLQALVADSSSLREPAPPLGAVVADHVARRDRDPAADVLGPLVVSDAALPQVQGVVDAEGAGRLDVVVRVGGGAGAIEPAVRWATRQPGLRLVGLAAAVRDLDDLGRGAHRVAAMVSQLAVEGLLEETRVQVELPLDARTEVSGRWQHALDTLAAEDLNLGLRVGGDDDVPEASTLAGAIGDALDREVAFGCVGDLRHAVARRDPATGRVRHGFLDVALATRASLDGADVDAVAERLTQTSAEMIVDDLALVGAAGMGSVRRWFVGCWSADVDASLADLRTLGLLPA